MWRKGLLLVSGLMLGITAGSQTAAPTGDYLPVIRPLQHGKAPKMKVQLLGENAGIRTYAVVLGVGDEVLAGLTEFAEMHHLAASRVTGIGAVSSATLGWLDLDRKAYRAVREPEQVEVTSMVGDIVLLNGKPSVHVHVTPGHSDGRVTGGHLIEAYVRPTLEVLVTDYPHALEKKMDPDIGMATIRPTPEP